MNKSASAGSLRLAGSAFVEMPHVPRRSVGHGVFTSSSEIVPTCLKPGQAHIYERQLYAEEAGPLQQSYLSQGMPSSSTYSKQHGDTVEPAHYQDPDKPIKQDVLSVEGGHHDCSHWRSEYRSSHNDAAVHGATAHRQYGPSYQANNPISCVSRPDEPTSYQGDYGKLGSDPRENCLPEHGPRQLTLKTSLTRGTCKATLHIPGYQGFLPTNISNPDVARVENGGAARPLDKHVLTAQYNTNLIGYMGHKPCHAKNDPGGVRPTLQTTAGSAFRAPALGVFPA